MTDTQEFTDFELPIGTFDGHPVSLTITAEEQREAAENGVTLDELIELEEHATNALNWQRDC